MSETDQATLEHQTEPTFKTIGSILKHQREALALSHEDIAHKLNLRLSIVKALEEDDYNVGLPMPYIIGYLKNYLRLLEINSPEATVLIDNLRQSEPPGQHRGTSAVDTNTKPINLYLAACITVAILSLALWFFLSNDDETPDTNIMPHEQAEMLTPNFEPEPQNHTHSDL